MEDFTKTVFSSFENNQIWQYVLNTPEGKAQTKLYASVIPFLKTPEKYKALTFLAKLKICSPVQSLVTVYH